MPTIHLMHGYLGAGKTTLARRLEQSLPAIRFTHDEWVVRLYGIDPPIDQFPDQVRRVSDLISATWPRCTALGLDVILDFGFWTRQSRDEARALAKSLGVTARLYRLACPDEEAWRRIERRNADLQDSLLIVRNTFEVLKVRFEPLGDDEERVEAVAEP